MTPVLTLESDHGSADIGSTEHSDSEQSNGSLRVNGERPARKWKPHSPAAEMLSFMQEHSAK